MGFPFSKLKQEDLAFFLGIVGEKGCSVSPEILDTYSHDWTENYRFPPEVVLKPISTAEISTILAYCNTNNLPVTPSGARTGLSGGMLPIHGGVLLSLENLNRILEIDTKNLQAVVEPGVITQVLQEAVEEKGLYYPPDPSSRGSCFIGGNLAESSGGLHAVKYGITKDYVLALEAVLPSGEIINTGARVLKNSTGYNLTQLLVGSEGTLGIITKAVLKLIPKPAFRKVLMVSFKDAYQACKAVSEIFMAGITPSALEFIERDGIDFGRAYLGMAPLQDPEIQAQLLIELDGSSLAAIDEALLAVGEVLVAMGCDEILVAESDAEIAEIFRLRRCLGEAVKGTTIYKEEDTVVPRATLAQLLGFVKKTGAAYGFTSVCYGHAGDGNLHVNIIKTPDLSEEDWEVKIPQAIREIFTFVKSLGGTISGEHGIGYVQKNFMDIVFSPTELGIMRQIKNVFDPNGILNPGKIFPDTK